MNTNEEEVNHLKDFPREVIEKMLDRQEEQTGTRDLTVLRGMPSAFATNSIIPGGFDWHKTIEEDIFWEAVINDKNFEVFFKKYPRRFSSHYSIVPVHVYT